MKPPPSARAIEEASAETGIPPAFIEKDWYAIQVVYLIADYSYQGMQPIFSGGTSLSKGYRLIQRFSEDIDFKISTATRTRRQDRRKYREAIIEMFNDVGGIVVDKDSIQSQDESRIFSFRVVYPQTQTRHDALRAHLQIEMSFHNPVLEAEFRPLRSFISDLARSDPDTYIQCLAPAETAAEKFSALIWRILSKDRNEPVGSIKNEPAMIRHLHDLDALKEYALNSPDFMPLVNAIYEVDKRRGDLAGRYTLLEAANLACARLNDDELYRTEYTHFVENMSYADDAERVAFSDALTSFMKIVSHLS